jgi:hypothetical protein
MGPTRHTNFPGRAGAGRFLALAVFQTAQKAFARLWSSDMESWKLETSLQRHSTVPFKPFALTAPCSCWDTTAADFGSVGSRPLTARYCRVPAQGVVPARLPKTHCKQMHAIAACIQTSPLSRRRRARRPPSQLELPVATLLLLSTRLR